MRGFTKILIISLFILLSLTSIAAAEPLDSWNHEFNPALLSIRNRKIVEFGLSVDALVSNSALGIDEIFTSEIVLDFDKIAEDLNGGSLMLNTCVSTEAHLVGTIFNIDVGVYADIDGVISAGIPGSFIDFLANGNDLDGIIDGSEDVYARVFYSSGIYAGYRWKDFQFGAKVGLFGPLLYTDSSASFDYSLSTNSGTGEITATAGLNAPFYSSVDFNNIDPNDLLQGMNGINMSIGAVRVKNNKAMYGLSVSGITVKPAVAKYLINMTTNAEITIDNIGDNFDSEDYSWITHDLIDPDFETLDADGYTVSTPIQIGGFYRLTGYPSFIDWIGHASVVFDDEVQLRAGITAQGSIPALSWFSLGLEYNRVYWNALLGLRANLRVLEIGVNVGLSAPELQHLLNANGLYGKFYMALGF